MKTIKIYLIVILVSLFSIALPSSFAIAYEKDDRGDIIEVDGVSIKNNEIIVKVKDNAKLAGFIPELLPDIPKSISYLKGTDYLQQLKLLNDKFGVYSIERVLPENKPKIDKYSIYKLSAKEWLVLEYREVVKFRKYLTDRNLKYIVTSEGYFFDNVRIANLNYAYVIKLRYNYDLESLKDICEAYMKNKDVEYAHFNYIYQLDAVPNDPLYRNTQEKVFRSINAEQAWDIISGSPDVIVAVIDSGVDIEHPDLQGRLIPGWNFSSNNNDVRDTDGHGTKVAGILGAHTNNGIGVAGTNWNCQIMPLKKAIPLTSNTLSRMIQYALDNGAQVINMSLGSYGLSERAYGPDTLAAQAVDNAYAQGVVCIATAGNDSLDKIRYPGALPPVICVAATGGEENNQRASYSNFGSWIDVSAPGEFRTTVIDNMNYGSSGGGTSFAAPCVSGLAALIIAHYGDQLGEGPERVDNIRKMIKYTATKLNTDRFIGTGRINMERALNDEPGVFAIISSPTKNSVLTGTVSVQGTVLGSSYGLYLLGEYDLIIFDSNRIAEGDEVIEGELGQLDTDDLEEGWYTLILQADGDFDSVDFYIDRSQKDGWPVLFEDIIGTTPNFAYIDSDIEQKVVVTTIIKQAGDYRTKFHVINSDGTVNTELMWDNLRSADQPVAIGDVSGGNNMDLIFACRENELNIKTDNFIDGEIWPKESIYTHTIDPLKIWKISCAPTLFDVDQDGILEIILGVDEREHRDDLEHHPKIYIFDDTEGNLLYPAIEINNTEDFIPNPPTITDLEGDGEMELVVRTARAIYVFNLDRDLEMAGLRNGWPCSYNNIIGYESGAVIGDINNDGAKEILMVAEEEDPDGSLSLKVFARQPNGQTVRGWPIEINRREDIGVETIYTTGLSLGNVDDDPELEIAIGTGESGRGKVYIWNHDGTQAFYKEHEDEEVRSVILFGDLESDQPERYPLLDSEEISIIGNGYEIYNLPIDDNFEIDKFDLYEPLGIGDADPNIGITLRIPKIPVYWENDVEPFGKLDDIDIIYATNGNKIHAYHLNGKRVSGFPRAIPDQSTQLGKSIDIALLDIDGNDTLELMASVMSGKGIYIWETRGIYNYSRIHWDRRLYRPSNNLDFNIAE